MSIPSPTIAINDSLRNRFGVGLANLALRIADEDYRRLTASAIYLGWELVSRDCKILVAAHDAADELDEWDGCTSPSLGDCSPGDVVRHAVHESMRLGVDDCPACNPDG